MLTVIAEGPGSMKYQWQKDGKDIMNEKIYEGANSRKLIIKHLQSKHAGQYRCLVENEHGTTLSEQVNLALKIRINVTEQMQTISAHFNEEVKIQLSATGQEPLEYQWKKDGKIISDASDRIYSGTNANELTIRSMSEKFQGRYQCVVSNDVDEDESQEISLTMKRRKRK